MQLTKTLIMILAASLLSACSNDFKPVEVEHAKGNLSIKNLPTKTIVLDMATLDNLDALGVKISGVPEGNLVNYLDKYQIDKYLKAGTLFEPNLEVIKNAKADLVIIGGRSASKYEQVAELAPTLDLSIDSDNYLASSQKRLTQLGQIFDKTSKAENLNAKLSNKIAKLKARSATAGRMVMLIVNEGKIGVINTKARMGWLYRDLGFTPISDNLEQFNRDNPMPLSFLTEQNPDWIFVIERDSAIGKGTPEYAAPKVLDQVEIRQTTAARKGQIVYLHPQESYIVGNGYTAITKIIEQIQNALDDAK